MHMSPVLSPDGQLLTLVEGMPSYWGAYHGFRPDVFKPIHFLDRQVLRPNYWMMTSSVPWDKEDTIVGENATQLWFEFSHYQTNKMSK